MRQVIQKWGNSLAVRIPKNLADSIHLNQGSVVNLFIESGNIVVEPIQEKKYSLKILLSGINDENKHSETETGETVGEEYW